MSKKSALAMVDSEIKLLREKRKRIASHTLKKCDDHNHLIEKTWTGGFHPRSSTCLEYKYHCLICDEYWYAYE